MIIQIKNAFPSSEANSCHEQYDWEEIRIHDAETSRCYVSNVRHENFLVLNRNKKVITFIPIDFCLFDGLDGATCRCECVIFDDKTFCFIELKNTMSTQGRTASGHRKTAAIQILDTYLYFVKNGISFKGYSLEGYVSFIIDPPVAVTATSLSDRYSLSQYDIEYFESAYKEFS